MDAIVWTLRLPTALMAVTVGCALGVSGAVMQTLLNLFRNAGEAMAGAGTLRIVVEPAGRWVRIVVADSGPGIPPGREGSRPGTRP